VIIRKAFLIKDLSSFMGGVHPAEERKPEKKSGSPDLDLRGKEEQKWRRKRRFEHYLGAFI